jgi:hypothetical protein
MATKCISSGKTPTTSPLASGFQVTLADKFLLARVQTFVSLSIMLSGKCLPADRANEWPLVSMGSQVRSQVVSSGEPLGAESALEGSRMFLYALGTAVILGVLVFRIS